MREESSKENKDTRTSGGHEQNSTLEEEIKAGEWQRLKEFAAYNRRSRQGKIIATYQAISNRLNQLVALYYELVRNYPDKSVRLLAEIKKLRVLQEFLLNCLIWERQGKFEENDIPPELEGLI